MPHVDQVFKTNWIEERKRVGNPKQEYASVLGDKRDRGI
jgi:hypothetical protein